MKLLSPPAWIDYELIDSGNFLKLERFGKITTIRPEPQAIWDPSVPYQKWKSMANVEFIPTSANSGKWEKSSSSIPDNWKISYPKLSLNCNLKLTGFKHVGVFPEQSANWDFIDESLRKMKSPKLNVLNIFAYTGMSSIAAKIGENVNVTHVDSVKQVVSWANDNMKSSNKDNIRWIVEDARKFVAKELRRGNKYNGIIMDPPAFGHGAKGESWKLEQDLKPLLKDIAQIIDPNEHFFILNTYSLGFSCLILENLMDTIFSNFTSGREVGELFLKDKYGKKLPLGVFARLLKTM
jgi:23S rRNA (cytosine1962-C5)-methyltransferase